MFVIPRNEESEANTLNRSTKTKTRTLKPQPTPIENNQCISTNTTYTSSPTKTKLFYTGITNNLQERMLQHYQNRQTNNSFSGKYAAYYLIFYEPHQYINKVIAREKEIKGWTRDKKWDIINSFNPEAKFLNEELFGQWPPKETLQTN